MSRRSRTLVRNELKNTLLPRSVLRAGAAGVLADSFGAGRENVRRAQEGFASGDIQEVTIWGLDKSGQARRKTTYRVNSNSDSSELVAITDDDSLDYITRTDRGMAQAVRHSVDDYKRNGLQTYTTFDYGSHIKNDPERLAEARRRYDTYPVDSPELPPGYDVINVATVVPGRDPNSSLTVSRVKRRR